MKKTIRIIIYVLVPLALLFAALFIGRYHVSLNEVLRVLGGLLTGRDNTSAGVSPESWTVVSQLRLPRLLAAVIAGAALSVSGGAYQCTFRNPLVSPGLLGVVAGSGFGAALAIVIGAPAAIKYIFAFGFGIIAVILSYWIAGIFRSVPTVMLVLGGVIVTAIFNALVSLLKYVADPTTQLPAIVFWLMGSLSDVGWNTLWAAVPTFAGIIICLALSWRMNVLSMGEREARTLGINVTATRALIVCGASLATAGAVCMCGVVGWVGLVIPHIARMLAGHDARKMLPVSISIGASFMIIIDTLCRTITSSELPLGILTALVGAPFFVFLLKRTKGGAWS